MKVQKKPLIVVFIVVLLMLSILIFYHKTRKHKSQFTDVSPTFSSTEATAETSMLHMQGTHLIDAKGNTILLRGAQIEGVLNVANPSAIDQQTIQHFPQLVKAMHDQWNMNVLRLPTCTWMWQRDQSGYISRLQTTVQQANAAGLYVVIENHDDHRCNPPYTTNTYHLPRDGMQTYWIAVAKTFKDNPMVLFDVYNEPSIRGRDREQYTDADWNLWKNGGTTSDGSFLGMQQLVNAIRATGASQIILVEGYAAGETWHNIGNNFVTDPFHNSMPETHKYALNESSTQWDMDFGFMSAKYPLLVGEWALMASDNSGQINCHTIPQSQADQTVQTFLAYMASHGINWTAYSFTLNHMLLDYSSFTPSSFTGPNYCTEKGSDGMGEIVKAYLTGNTQYTSLSQYLYFS